MEWKAKEDREGDGRDRKYGERKRKKGPGQWIQHPRTWRTQEEKRAEGRDVRPCHRADVCCRHVHPDKLNNKSVLLSLEAVLKFPMENRLRLVAGELRERN